MYHYLEDVAIADVAYEVHAGSLPELFRDAAEALAKVQVDNLEEVRRARLVKIAVERDQLDMLLYAFLQELVYHKDAQRLILLVEKVEITEGADGRYRLRADAAGEEFDPERHRLNADVKAVTMHRFELVPTPEGAWRATVVLDI